MTLKYMTLPVANVSCRITMTLHFEAITLTAIAQCPAIAYAGWSGLSDAN